MEDIPVNQPAPEPQAPQPPPPPEKAFLSIAEFKKIELKIAQIKAVADHPNADKLYVITVDAGDRAKQIVAGIKRGYSKEDLVGKYIVLVDNLAPAVLRGVESQGMLLAASDGDTVAVLSPDKPVRPGSAIK